MNPVRRVLTAVLASALLFVGGTALAAPAQAQPNAHEQLDLPPLDKVLDKITSSVNQLLD